MYLGFSALTYRPISLPASNRAFLFLFMVFMISPSKLISSAHTRSYVSCQIPVPPACSFGVS